MLPLLDTNPSIAPAPLLNLRAFAQVSGSTAADGALRDSSVDIPAKPETPCACAKINKGCNYPRLRVNGKTRARHVHEWEKVNGPLPAGMNVDHLCRNKACIRLDHLEAVPSRVNVLRGVGPTAQNSRKTSCKRGHDLSGTNLRVDSHGWRSCRECQRTHVRNYDTRNGLTNHHRLLTPH